MIENAILSNLTHGSGIRRAAKKLAPQAEKLLPQASRLAPDALVSGGSPIGEAVRKSFRPDAERSVKLSHVDTRGKIEEVWVKGFEVDQNEVWEQMAKEIDQAQHEVRLQTFVIAYQSKSFQRVMEALARKQRANPNFKVMINYGGEFRYHTNPKTVIKCLPRAWNNTELKAALRKHGIDAQVSSFVRGPNLNALHAKTAIIDGRIGILGSANLCDTQSKEVMLKVSGPVVDGLLQEFKTTFEDAAHRFEMVGGETRGLAVDGLWAAPEADRAAKPGMQRLALLTNPAGGHYLADDATRGLLAAIGAAQQEIKIFTPNFNNRDVWAAMVEAANRGVRIKLMLPKDFNNLRSLLDGGNNYQFLTRDLAQLPAKLRNRFEVRWFSADGITTGPKTNHIKYMSIDGKWTYVGSQNFDNQAWKNSEELGLGIDDAAQTQALARELFDKDWANSFPVKPPKRAGNPVRRLIQRWFGF